MALNPPFIVRIETKPDASFGAIMSGIRSWLDHCKIEPVAFHPIAGAEPEAGSYVIGFHTEDEARRFEREFHALER